MITLLLGTDEFSKKLYLDSLAKELASELEFFLYEKPSDLEKIKERELFGKPKLYVLENLITRIMAENSLESLINLPNQVVFLQDKLDKRLADTKTLLQNKKILVKEFVLPSGPELLVWIETRVKNLGGQIEKNAVKLLAFGFEGLNVGGFGYAPDYSLWQVDLEIQKLLTFAEGKTISQEMVENLVVNESEINVFKISDAIASKNFALAEKLISNFLASKNSVDVKGGVLQLSAILAEQFRNILAVQNLQKLGKSPEEIAKIAGWKNASRVSVMSRMANGFTHEKIKSFLQKLSLLDLEMKISASPPRVVFDLVLSQLVL